ncbi:hypothetical protein PGT21_026013 [Puccinia graminis f. sp. tritici]|uniref:Uncharacterized protein n=1 Tax=Puccinia graminis f. sp. tritici TaxID=56615 RepID=A0A5B0QZ51_PUCGR|nr:hypothetical protein PGT21_026013 [Puccinia graminis f. sp. tritici]KAA1118578.1 hypothetical protein PGTUg99_011330 [Puccinia graminis f. sp. tritici]
MHRLLNVSRDQGIIISEMTDHPGVVSETSAQELQIAFKAVADGSSVELGLETFEVEVPTLYPMIEPLFSQVAKAQLVLPPVDSSNRYTQHQIRVRKRSDSVDAVTDSWNAINWSLITTRESQMTHRSCSVGSIPEHQARVKFRSHHKIIYSQSRHKRIDLPLDAQRALYPLPPPRKKQMLVSSARHLIGDVAEAKNRLLITKTHCLYPEVSNLIPFPSCLIGFRLVVHPCHPKSRVKHLRIRLVLRKKDEKYDRSLLTVMGSPVIKAIYPVDGKIHETGSRTSVETTRQTSVGVQLGVDQYGTATLNRAQSVKHHGYTAPYVSASGVHTSELDLTMSEDSSLKDGVARSLYFAALLEFDSAADRSFEASLMVETQFQKELPFKLWSSPKTWVLDYDGKTELGQLNLST